MYLISDHFNSNHETLSSDIANNFQLIPKFSQFQKHVCAQILGSLLNPFLFYYLLYTANSIWQVRHALLSIESKKYLVQFPLLFYSKK